MFYVSFCKGIFFFSFYFYKLLAACCQGYELGGRLDTVEKADVVEVREERRLFEKFFPNSF